MSMSQTSLAAAPVAPALDSERPSWLSEELFPFQSRFLSVAGTRFHYVDEGSGKTLLFLHGGPMSSFMWRAQLGELRHKFRCIAVDIPGLGLSRTRLVRGAGFANMADSLQAFVHALELNDFVLIAHATGGPAGLEMAIRERPRLRGLVVSNTFAWPLALVPKLRTIVGIVSSRLFSFLVVRFNLLAKLAAKNGRKHAAFNQAERAAVLGPYLERQTRAHLANLLYGLRAETPFFARLKARLSGLAGVPSLLLFGDEDNGYKAGFMQQFERALPLHSSVVLPKAAHFLTEDAPEQYTRALAGWLATLPRS